MKTPKIILFSCFFMLTCSSAQAIEPMRFIYGFIEVAKFTSLEVNSGSQGNNGSNHRRWKKHHQKRWKKHHQRKDQKKITNSVPELDSSNAPLAGILLVCLLAAGVERRRRSIANE